MISNLRCGYQCEIRFTVEKAMAWRALSCNMSSVRQYPLVGFRAAARLDTSFGDYYLPDAPSFEAVVFPLLLHHITFRDSSSVRSVLPVARRQRVAWEVQATMVSRPPIGDHSREEAMRGRQCFNHRDQTKSPCLVTEATSWAYPSELK